eukprot:85519_1
MGRSKLHLNPRRHAARRTSHDGDPKITRERPASSYGRDARSVEFMPRTHGVSQIGASAPAWSFGSRFDLPRHSSASTPAPDSYRLPSTVGRGAPSYAFGTKYRHMRYSHTPGPMEYDTMDSVRSVSRSYPSYSITSRESLPSTTLASYEVPGPGQYRGEQAYQARVVGRAAPVFSIGGRRPEPPPGDVPGPGMYQIRGSTAGGWGPASPQYSIRTRRKNGSERWKTPGPGTYNLDNQRPIRNPPRYSMGTRFRERKAKRTPGPGAYQISSPLGNAGMRNKAIPRYRERSTF